MKNLVYALFFICISVTFSLGQVSTRLVTITEGSPTVLSGLGVSFYGVVMNDGNLYFQASGNGLQDAVWKTDGTISGTSKVVEEVNTFGENWNQLVLVNEGVLINENNDWSILAPGSSELKALPNMPEERINRLQLVEDTYYFTTTRVDTLILHTSNIGFTDVQEVGSLYPSNFFLLLSAGTEGALIFSNSSFHVDIPSVYLKSTSQIIPIAEYFASLSLSFSQFGHGYVINNFLLVSYMDEANFFQNKIIDMADGSVADFAFFGDPITHYSYGENIILITQREVISFNTNDMSSTKLYDNVFTFTTSLLEDDKLYILGINDNFNEGVVEIDLTDGTSRFLNNATTGNSFYGCKMEYFNNEFYYIAEDDYQLLMKYDFTADEPVVVDTLSIKTGTTVSHALQKVKGQLVLSKRIGFQQHELYALGNGISNTVQNIELIELKANPTISENSVRINTLAISSKREFDVLIYDISGGIVDVRQLSNGILNIQDLPKSQYFGIIKEGGKVYKVRFVKM